MKLEEIKQLCFDEDALQNSRFTASLKEAEPILDRFCIKYGVCLLNVTVSSEAGDNPISEPLYIFSDDLGGYTLKGLENSL